MLGRSGSIKASVVCPVCLTRLRVVYIVRSFRDRSRLPWRRERQYFLEKEASP
jgi:hypothetical protein